MYVSQPIVVLDKQDRRMFAFEPATDPYEVLHAVAWEYTRGVKLCGLGGCPAGDRGGYCMECHLIGWAALDEARRRPEASVAPAATIGPSTATKGGDT